jgi:hypothetical protein
MLMATPLLFLKLVENTTYASVWKRDSHPLLRISNPYPGML